MSWSDGNNYCLLQRGNGYYEDSEDSQSSQETDSSQSSQETDSSSQEVAEHLNPWSRILDEAQERHEVQLNALVDEYKRNGDWENIAHLKAQNALLPLYRKELRKVLLEYLPVRAIDIAVYMVSCNMIGRGKTKTKKFGRGVLGRPRPCARKCERRPYCNAATSP